MKKKMVYCSEKSKQLKFGLAKISMVSLTSSLRGQLVKCFTALLPNILIIFFEKMWEAFALQQLLTFCQ